MIKKLNVKGLLYENQGFEINFCQNIWVQNENLVKSMSVAALTTPTLTRSLGVQTLFSDKWRLEFD